eukprot:5848666-Ditylum_brightwellii.AAC.1
MDNSSEVATKDYVVKKKPIIARTPQSNSIMERIHQIIANTIRSLEVYVTEVDTKDPWTQILIAVRYATRTIVYTTMSFNHYVILHRYQHTSKDLMILEMAKPMAPVLYRCTYWGPNFYTQANHCSRWGQPCPLSLQDWPNTKLQHHPRPQ